MDIFLGISASDGIGIGSAFVIPEVSKRIIPDTPIKNIEHESQWGRFQTALQKVSTQVAKQLDAAKGNKVQSEIFETYFLMLNDPEFIADVQRTFEGCDMPVEFVLNQKTEEYADKLRSSGNEYLAERAQDICDIFGRVLNELLDYHPFDIESVPDGAVIVARAMSPSDTIILSKRKIAGLALIEGGVSSHVGILARNFGIPAVFDLHRITEHAKSGQTAIVDGVRGELILNPDKTTLDDYTKKIAEYEEQRQKLAEYREKPAQTKDGIRFTLMANIGTVEEAKIAMAEGADGIGLFRTEFLFMSNNSAAPINASHASDAAFSEEAQFKAYKDVLEIMQGKPVTIRTLDAGGDKLIRLSSVPLNAEKNPLLGLRAIRLSLHYPSQLKTQLRALYRASIYGNLSIMLPLITSVAQVKQVLHIAESVRKELAEDGIPFNPDVPIGIMVETAAAAITVDCLAKVCSFFSIGTNDLTQYTIGVDRENIEVAPMYDETHLAVLRLIQTTIQYGTKFGLPVSVCGEMASRKNTVMVLAGLGIRKLSMSPTLISGVKELLSQYTISDLEAVSQIAIQPE
ncbi:MAG: phosphoenolpyruvate--protein phosphotransferase [Treponema sp.]|nr:phosphoenolpyruvate--protein phosphotransferase [Treponema sp.]